MSEFSTFRDAVKARFDQITAQGAEINAGGLYLANVSKEEIWNIYQTAFPQGTNEIYRVRKKHDCACCKRFVTTLGRVIALDSRGVVSTVWDDFGHRYLGSVYADVAPQLRSLVRIANIADAFFVNNEKDFYNISVEKNHEVLPDGSIQVWEHFHAIVPEYLRVKSAAQSQGERRENFSLLKRTLLEVSEETTLTLIDLIENGSIYRGQEGLAVLHRLAQLQQQYSKVFIGEDDSAKRHRFYWAKSLDVAVARFRTTLLGALLIDLQANNDLDAMEAAVKKYETLAAPQNYKRPTALVSAAQRDAAKAELQKLGLFGLLQRRPATLDDVPVEHALFVDRTPAKVTDAEVALSGFDKIAVVSSGTTTGESITLSEFVKNVVPNASSIEAFFENSQRDNLVQLTTAQDTQAKSAFKWDNHLAWSYAGNYADAIKTRVKEAGGNVTGDVCIRLAWDGTDDYDLHLSEPDGYHIFFPSRRKASPCGGTLDVDANGLDGIRNDPCENIVYPKKSTMKNGEYKVAVHNFRRRSDCVGFTLQLEIEGVVTNLTYDKILRENAVVEACVLNVKNGVIAVEPCKGMVETSTRTSTLWGLQTQAWHPVAAIMHSPNHWGENASGLKHTFVLLKGAKPDEAVRCFYNEFLVDYLQKHRKTLELVGSVTKIAPVDNSLCGVGFTHKDAQVKFRVTTAKGKKLYNVAINQ